MFTLPGQNAVVERLFSMIFNLWTDNKSQLGMESVTQISQIKFNLNYSGVEFLEILK